MSSPEHPQKPLWNQPIFIVLAGVLLLGLFLVLAAVILRSGTESASGETTTTSIESATTIVDSTTTSAPATTSTTIATSSSSTTSRAPSGSIIEFEGSGKSVEPVPALTDEQFVLEVTINEGIVKLTDGAGTSIQIPFLWSRWPDYEGVTLIPNPPAVEFLEVDPDNLSPWKVVIRPLNVDDVAKVPGTITGSSDDLVYIDGSGEATVVTIDGVCDRYGIVTVSAYSQSGERLAWSPFLWDEGDLPGEMLMPEGVVLLAVTGEPCSWQIEWP